MDAEARLRLRARIVRAIRCYFDNQGFIEIDTPVAITAPAPEPHIETPCVTLRTTGAEHQRFLQPSPEMLMKRTLVAAPCIYQIAPCFRQGDLSAIHRPEFRLLEWYRRDASWTTLLDDCEGLLRACAMAAYGTTTIPGSNLDLGSPFQRITVEEAFLEHAGFSILQAIDKPTLQHRLREADQHFREDDTWNDLFHRIFLTRVEPALAQGGRPYFLVDYPAPLQMYAQLKQHDLRASERFELYVGGMELANGYGELVQADAARLRFNVDATMRQRAKMQKYPTDDRYFEALGRLPPSAGIALGVERLLLVIMNAGDIDEISAVKWTES
jgi:lysyl-tRNA synthetase class 2